MRTFATPDDLVAAQGEEIGPSEWLVVDQDLIDRFADATDDHQWIHVDAERAAAGPFGTTIAHGFLTLTLLPRFLKTMYRVEGGYRMGLNYGLNKVRMIAPVPVGSRLRATATVAEAIEVSGGVQVTFAGTVEIEGSDKPACYAEFIVRLVR